MAKTDKKQPTFTHKDAVNFYEQKEIAEKTKIPKPEITHPSLSQSQQTQSIEGIVGFVLEWFQKHNGWDSIEKMKSDIIKEYNNGK